MCHLGHPSGDALSAKASAERHLPALEHLRNAVFQWIPVGLHHVLDHERRLQGWALNEATDRRHQLYVHVNEHNTQKTPDPSPPAWRRVLFEESICCASSSSFAEHPQMPGRLPPVAAYDSNFLFIIHRKLAEADVIQLAARSILRHLLPSSSQDSSV